MLSSMRLTRRQAIVVGAVGIPVTALATVLFRHGSDPGDMVSDGERRALRVLTVNEYATLKAAIVRLTRSDRPDFPPAEAVGAPLFAERFLAGLAPRDRTDMKRLLALLEHVLPLWHGTTQPFWRASGEVQDAILREMETSRVTVLRAALGALKQCAALAYFRHARTWPAIGYDGPWVPPRDAPLPRPVRGTPIPRSEEERFDVDVVVVGSGAGGSMAAREIARSGARVLLLEEGPDFPPESFTQREDEMLPVLFQDGAGRATRDRAIHILQGRGLGGSTLHNQNLCKRAPSQILEQWSQRGCEGWDPRSMDPLFAEVERDLHVTPIDVTDVNANNDVLRRGIAVLGWRGGGLHHNRDGCIRSGFCELGCAYDAKNNARKIVIPQAVAAGALVRTETRVERVMVQQGRVTGVLARDVRTGRPVTVRARAVVLAGSAIGSAALSLASGISDPYGQVGRGLHLHPAGVVAGLFDREIAGWRGIPQSWECTEWLRFEPGSDRRIWIVPAFAHPVGTAAMLPGVGPAWTNRMRDYRRIAVLTAMLHDESEGRVTVTHGRPVIDYVLHRSDRAQLARGLRACAEILLAAGARTVLLPFAPPIEIRRASDLSWLTADVLVPHAIPLTAVHPMGTMRIGSDPRQSVCDPRGQHHHVRGLYVADGGLFPTSLGGPPQITIYAAGLKVGRHVVEDLRRS